MQKCFICMEHRLKKYYLKYCTLFKLVWYKFFPSYKSDKKSGIINIYRTICEHDRCLEKYWSTCYMCFCITYKVLGQKYA